MEPSVATSQAQRLESIIICHFRLWFLKMVLQQNLTPKLIELSYGGSPIKLETNKFD